jgi:hypothetical protein
MIDRKLKYQRKIIFHVATRIVSHIPSLNFGFIDGAVPDYISDEIIDLAKHQEITNI